MKELLVISGKGGTGKTSIVGSLAALAKNKVLADCDVDAADLHLLLRPVVRRTMEFTSSRQAFVDEQKCTSCGLCAEVCRFDAIAMAHCGSGGGSALIDPIACEGCGVCSHVCPECAISMRDALSGHWFVSDTDYGPMVHARLRAAEENSGKLVTEVRREARRIAQEAGLDYIIADGPPGIGCPVISCMSGVDLALVVTEPTVAGVHDLQRVLDLASHFGVKACVCINKYDLHEANSRRIEDYCGNRGVEVVGKIPFDREVVAALANGQPAVTGGGAAAEAIRGLWNRLDEECMEE